MIIEVKNGTMLEASIEKACLVKLQKENQELKKQLKNTDYTTVYLKGCTDTKGKYLSQQKEFIKYLEDEIMEIRAKWGNALSNASQLDVAITVRAYEDILSKYKEIIGGDNK